MIISASRRTDIPAFYSDWFVNRLREGFVYVRNPMNYRQISHISLKPEVVDCIVFWTKNALPLLTKLPVIDAMGFVYYFQFTITPYDAKLERHVPDKYQIIEGFKRLSDTIGKERVVWRYDPVIVTKFFSVSKHLECFSALCQSLRNYTERCVFSYVDVYGKHKGRQEGAAIVELEDEARQTIARGFADIARENRLILQVCVEDLDRQRYNISEAACIDREIIETVTGYKLKPKKDNNQRSGCRCLESVDIGAYNSCRHGCNYCYAVDDDYGACKNSVYHQIHSPLLLGQVEAGDRIIPRKLTVLRDKQEALFEL
ncbi:DUF1848 domain-containing protein [Propionispora vibrioides]|uniref:DNA repair photolyase n=1 Tax=Propionispora vibrioides TaxID=112903 RepID=A0A1H8XIX3_9FIRM|nr:DUF1848 domain-containing protein [Propionispora vibrioides]SEP39773.1 protein of unknown function [Propionispora vibrioides]